MRFEWDEQKNLLNIRKHGVDFQDAVEIFEHPMLEWEQDDAQAEHGETRINAIGLMQGFEVFAVYTERDDGQTIRLISVRQANQYERQEYYRFCVGHFSD